MTQFKISDDFWSLFPDACFGIVLAHDVQNKNLNSEAMTAISKFLDESHHDAQKHLTEDVLSQNTVVSVWRDAYQKFKTKKGARVSIEALLKRVSKGNTVGSINPLVDIYNAISLTYGLPCGGEDIDTFVGSLRLIKTQGNDSFMALGDTEPDNTLPGEIAYVDDVGAVCRCWNWRDGQRTMLTNDTTNAFLIIECVDPTRRDDLEKATQHLATYVEQYLGGSVKSTIMDYENVSLNLE
ncbi:B3/4 domain-containing protein [Erysipelothrix enhydrae]|uniref:B3/B4 domain-containing protein n=1 Tax=Erysipelothrix enhydrae TaxID=2890314 RepID=UPI002B24F9D8|nr:B3/4 domain-containing protein [Erysipelothrix sp. 4322-04]WRB86395.1 B3/4 domain-containing protein [Erysipelothrix sp. 4322-04]